MANKKKIEKKVRRKGYADLRNDYMFKKIFGTEGCKDILIAFLNCVMGDECVIDVRFNPQEHLGPTQEDRTAVTDIACTTNDGSEFVLEMQNAWQPYFVDRALYYAAYPIISQGEVARREHEELYGGSRKFAWDFNLKPVVIISLLNFRIRHGDGWENDRYHSSYMIREDRTGEVLHDKLKLVFFELARFDKTEDECETLYDKWIYLFKHMTSLKRRPKKFTGKVFDRLFQIAKFSNFRPSEYKKYQKREKMRYDYHNTIEGAKILGRSEAQTEIARKFKELGVDIETIAKATGLDAEAVEALTAVQCP